MPWRLIGETVRVVIAGDLLCISHAEREVAVHHRRTGRFERVIDPVHFDDVVGFGSKARLATVQLPNRSAQMSYCARSSNTSVWSDGAGDGA